MFHAQLGLFMHATNQTSYKGQTALFHVAVEKDTLTLARRALHAQKHIHM